ncbi:MAG: hypothetical protein WCJ81_02055 [bacterium]
MSLVKKTSFDARLENFKSQITALDPKYKDPGIEEKTTTPTEYTETLQQFVSALQVIPQKHTKTIISLLYQALNYRQDLKDSSTAAQLAPIEIIQKNKDHGHHAIYILFQLNTKGELFSIL